MVLLSGRFVVGRVFGRPKCRELLIDISPATEGADRRVDPVDISGGIVGIRDLAHAWH